MLVSIKFSEVILYDGLLDRLKIFADFLAYRMKVIQCTFETNTKNLVDIFNSYTGYDCLFYLQNPN